MADTGYHFRKSSAKVEEKLKGRKWPTFSLEMQTVLVYPRVDDLICEKKPGLADPVDPVTLAGIIEARSY